VVSSLADVIAFNNAFVAGGEKVGLKYGQDILLPPRPWTLAQTAATPLGITRTGARDLDLARTKSLDVMYQTYDAVLFPANRGAAIGGARRLSEHRGSRWFHCNPAVPPPPLTPPTPFPQASTPNPHRTA